MKSDSLTHDQAMTLAATLLGIIENLLREEERRDCFDAFYTACKAGLEQYEAKAERTHRRIHPSRN